MARPKSNGTYAKLSATYYDDDAILEAGPHAELLWVRYLAFTALLPTDGYVTDRQMRVRVGRGLRDVSGRLRSLVEVGLLVAVDDGYVSRSWQKWNRSADEIGRHLAKDRERKARKSGEDDQNSTRNGDTFQSDSADQSKAKQSKTTTPKGVVRATRLPPSWSPSDACLKYAHENRIDLQHEVGQFRAHADANARVQRNWDAAFRQWLGNAKKWTKETGKGPVVVPPKLNGPCAHRFVGGFCAECSEREP